MAERTFCGLLPRRRRDSIDFESENNMRPANKTENKRITFEHWHMVTICLIFYDLLAVFASYFMALWLRFDCRISAIPPVYLDGFIRFIPLYAVACVLIFWALRLYKSIWRFASYNELFRVTIATAITAVIHVLGSIITLNLDKNLEISRMPMSYYGMGILLQFFLVLVVRFAYRFVLLLREWRRSTDAYVTGNVLLIGAGSAGQMILRDLNNRKESPDRVRCIIDDNPNKWGRYIGKPALQDLLPSAWHGHWYTEVHENIPHRF